MSKIREGFYFNGIHTNDFNLRLKERQAPTPEEKSIIEDVPFMQGVYDFSMILGERVYSNRPLSYQFEVYNNRYNNRKVLETKLKNWLMNSWISKLYDTHDYGYYWLAKCTNVSVNDDHPGNKLVVGVTFDAYPFMKSNLEEGHDIWDEFNFELDYAQSNEFEINGSKNISLFNIGSTGVVPTVTTNSQMSIIKEGVTYTIPIGESKSGSFRLSVGENDMTVSGNGTIKFSFYKELL